MKAGRQANRALLKQRAGALGTAVLLHVIFVLALLAAASGTSPRGANTPFGEGDAIEISLSGREGAAGGWPVTDAAERRAQVDPIDQIARRLRAERSDLFTSKAEPTRPRGNLASLFRSTGRLEAQGQQGDGARLAGRTDESGQVADTSRASRAGTPSQDDGSKGLWGQVEPCWRKLKQRSTVPVTLEVVLNQTGGLALPPHIIRPDGNRPDERRLVAEAQALAAIQACLPYRSLLGRQAGTTYRLNFGSRK